MENFLKEKVIEALQVWLAQHPAPDAVVLQLAGGIDLSPREIVHHVQKEDKIGQLQLDVIEQAMKQFGTDEVIEGLKGFRQPPTGFPP